ncbi:hypothetical protein R3P38DRAFT_3035662 [Favolaschia claudopus]|uniref:C2H2-type domain-containing protein n=1 Tax=Favolaschia claudopus TaxID=2862362 RepID=A0AAW0ACM9_9AGAR
MMPIPTRSKRHTSYTQSTRSVNEFDCGKCEKVFETLSALKDHYRSKPESIHPNCIRCGVGCYDSNALADHATSHPREKCSCGLHLFVEDIPCHYSLHTDSSDCSPGVVYRSSVLRSYVRFFFHVSSIDPETIL